MSMCHINFVYLQVIFSYRSIVSYRSRVPTYRSIVEAESNTFLPIMSVFLSKKWPKMAKKGRKKATLYTNVANFQYGAPWRNRTTDSSLPWMRNTILLRGQH